MERSSASYAPSITPAAPIWVQQGTTELGRPYGHLRTDLGLFGFPISKVVASSQSHVGHSSSPTTQADVGNVNHGQSLPYVLLSTLYVIARAPFSCFLSSFSANASSLVARPFRDPLILPSCC